MVLQQLLEKFPEDKSLQFIQQHQITLNYVLESFLLDLPQDSQALRLLEGVVFFYQKYQCITDAAKRTKVFHQDVDDIISRDLFGVAGLGHEIICSKGCSSCCSQPVMVTQSEANLLMETARLKSVGIDWDKIEKQKDLNMESWTTSLQEAEARCVFLENTSGACQVWENRPANCRNYFVTGSNAHCSIFNRNSDISRSMKSILADVCISAFYALEQGDLMLAEVLFRQKADSALLNN